MKKFNKTIIALTLSLIGAASSVSALAMATDKTEKEVQVEILGDSSKDFNVFVSVDGEVSSVDVSPSDINNPEELEKLLVDVPKELREKLIASLTKVNLDDGHVKVIVNGDISDELHWTSENGNTIEHDIKVIGDDGTSKVMVMKFDGNSSEGDVEQVVIEKIIHSAIKPAHHKNVRVIHKGNMSANSIIRMIKHSEFTAEELNKIQQSLDAKK